MILIKYSVTYLTRAKRIPVNLRIWRIVCPDSYSLQIASSLVSEENIKIIFRNNKRSQGTVFEIQFSIYVSLGNGNFLCIAIGGLQLRWVKKATL